MPSRSWSFRKNVKLLNRIGENWGICCTKWTFCVFLLKISQLLKITILNWCFRMVGWVNNVSKLEYVCPPDLQVYEKTKNYWIELLKLEIRSIQNHHFFKRIQRFYLNKKMHTSAFWKMMTSSSKIEKCWRHQKMKNDDVIKNEKCWRHPKMKNGKRKMLTSSKNWT